MKKRNLLIQISVLFMVSALSLACAMLALKPTAIPPTTAPPTAAPPTAVPATATPTEIPPTATPEPVISMQGTINFTGANQDPFATTLILHGKDDFKNSYNTKSGTDGKYSFTDVKPGEYNLWVLINEKAEKLPNCSDVVFPDKTWIAGIQIDQTTAITTETDLFSKAITAAEAFGASGWVSSTTGSNTATGIYAVSPLVTIAQDKTTDQNVILTCK